MSSFGGRKPSKKGSWKVLGSSDSKLHRTTPAPASSAAVIRTSMYMPGLRSTSSEKLERPGGTLTVVLPKEMVPREKVDRSRLETSRLSSMVTT